MTAVAPNNTGKMDAMSRALGAAFLTHQVEKLEQTVSDTRPPPRSFSKKTGRAWGRFNTEEYPRIDDAEPEKAAPALDASVIVVDSSVLIHSLSYLNNILHPRRRSASNEQSPIVVVPLEALNTLDMLKKGSSQSAKKAREASRLLEREVGENPLLRVQGDRDYVTWNMIDFQGEGEQKPDPEWMRRALCCAAWEVRNPKDAGKVVIAVCTPPEVADPGAALRQEYRAGGILMAHWTRKAGLQLVEVPMDVEMAPRGKDSGRSSSETERERPAPSRRGRGGARGGGNGNGGGEFSSRPPGNMSSFKPLKPPGPRSFDRASTSPKPFAPTAFLSRSNYPKGSPPTNRGLVEKPPAIAPSSGKVIRVLARGEKLD